MIGIQANSRRLNDHSLPVRVNYNEPNAAEKIASSVTALITGYEPEYRELLRMILCIGSDRSTGDALGPLVGNHLAKLQLPRTIVLGTLAEPVHALNLETYLNQLEKDGGSSLIIAVDASLGKLGSVGIVEVGRGPLHPGAGVNKKLPPVGHIYLSGIVNLGGFMEQMVLQSTRLFHVMELARVISSGLQRTLSEV